MIQTHASVVINRPVEQVFDFVSNPEHDPEWSSGVVEVRKLSEDPWGPGTRYVYVRSFLGRRLEVSGAVTQFDAPQRYAFASGNDAVKATGSLDFEPVDGGTRVDFSMAIESGGLFKLAEPVMAKIVQHQMQSDFEVLKHLLEAPGDLHSVWSTNA
ncbi:MAG: SRPBCC family protein [Thermaerobacter sp.]|nr:SRPBCC family protein [Thermaerobacter sp.]